MVTSIAVRSSSPFADVNVPRIWRESEVPFELDQTGNRATPTAPVVPPTTLVAPYRDSHSQDITTLNLADSNRISMFDGHHVLDGVRVLDVGTYLTAPKPARTLAEFGAEVIKVERPEGSPLRRATQFGDPVDGITSLHAIVNSGKKSIGLDLASETGRDVFLDLARDADVLIENQAPGSMERFGLTYDDVRAVNEDIVYCSVSGFGETGPLADRKVVDFLIQGMGGLAHQNGLARGDAVPALTGWFAVDELTAAYVTISIMGALIGDRGTRIDVSLLDVLLGSYSAKSASYSVDEEILPPGAKGRREGPRGLYETATEPLTFDVLPPVPERFLALWEVLGLEEWVEAERYTTVDEIFENEVHVERRVSEQFASRPREYWLEALWDAGFVAAPVLTVEEAFEHEQMEHRTVLSSLEDERIGEYLQLNFPAIYSAMDVGTSVPAPLLGEHTRDHLSQAGYSDEEIEGLYDAEVVA